MDDDQDVPLRFPSKVMHLFIKTADDFFDIPGICLSQGFIPTVGYKEAPFNADFTQFPLEPAVWFKVQVLDSVAIDCTKCCLSWNTSDFLPQGETTEVPAGGSSPVNLPGIGWTSPEEVAAIMTGGTSGQAGTAARNRRERRRQVTYTMYVTDNMAVTPDANLEKLYSSMRLLMKHNNAGHIPDDKFHEIIRQLLHQHVLPSVSLSQEDLPKLVDACNFQERIWKKYSQDITLKDKNQLELLRAMENHRTKFMQLLLDPSSPKWPYSAKLSNVLFEHLERDLKSSKHSLETAETSLEMSEQHEGSSSVAQEGDLTGKRQKAAWHRGVHTELEMSRNKLHDIIHKRFKISWGKPNHNQKIVESLYIAMNDQLKELKKEIEILIRKQVLTKSVLEAMQATIKDLGENKESLGIDTGRTGDRKVTDILRRTRVPREWLTLSEQIAELVSNKQESIGKSCHSFCGQFLIDKKGAFEEYHRRQELFAKNQQEKDKTPPSSMNADKRMSGILKKRISKEKLKRQGSQKKGPAGAKLPVERQESGASSTSKTSSVTDSMTHSMLAKTFSDKMEVITQRMSWSLSESGCGETIKASDGSKLGKQTAWNTLPAYQNAPEPSTATWYVDREEKEELGNVTVEGLEDLDEMIVHVFVHHQGVHFLERSKDKIIAKIHQHFREVCSAVQKITRCRTDTSRKNIWLCYEPHVFESIITDLVEIYSEIFESDCETLTAGIPTLTVGVLQMEDTGVMGMIEGSSGQQARSPGKKTRDEPEYPSFKSLPDFSPGKVTSVPNTSSNSNKSPSSLNSSLPARLKPHYLHAFQEGFQHARSAIRNPIPLLKLRHLERCLMKCSETVALHLREDPNHSTADHMLLSLQLLLCNLPPDDTTGLYITINLLSDYLPDFFTAGLYENILTHFLAAYATLTCCIKAKPGPSS